ncbi:MAG TPA: iron ABC transporter permease [Gemmatimonadales bacterium]|nr:iron ABC transporter permease [Gemmatimonadales bacterium]
MTWKWVALAAGSVAAVALAIAVGPVSLTPTDVILALRGRGDPTVGGIVRELRVPRALIAFLVGGSLAVTGAALQALVRNALADPYLLGLSGGAGLGAVAAIAAGVRGAWAVPAAAFAGALLAITLVYRLALVAAGAVESRLLILAGVVVGAFASAIMGALLSVSQAPELRSALLWLLGGFQASSWLTVGVFTAYAVVPLAVIAAAHRALDLLTLGDEPAQFLGADIGAVKRRVYLAASFLTAAAVAVSGIIGFIGLVVPHAIRLLLGHVHATMLPAAFLLGGMLLVLADAAARTVVAPIELPVGVVTALIGVPVFAVLLRRWIR